MDEPKITSASRSSIQEKPKPVKRKPSKFPPHLIPPDQSICKGCAYFKSLHGGEQGGDHACHHLLETDKRSGRKKDHCDTYTPRKAKRSTNKKE